MDALSKTTPHAQNPKEAKALWERVTNASEIPQELPGDIDLGYERNQSLVSRKRAQKTTDDGIVSNAKRKARLIAPRKKRMGNRIEMLKGARFTKIGWGSGKDML